MKNFKLIASAIITVFILTFVHGQDEGPVSEMYLKGKWDAECIMEVLNHSLIRSCELCPWVVDPNNKSKASNKDIEMDFGADSLTLNQNGAITTVPFTRNKDTHAFTFALNSRQYSFRVFYYNKQRILEDNDGLLMVLTKVNLEK